MILNNRLKPLSALALLAVSLPFLISACGSDNPLSSVQEAACCTEFKVGEDMTNVDFGVDADIKGSFAAFANAASDLSAVGTASLNDVTTSCMNIALDLGADPDDKKVAGKTGREALSGWCKLAKAQIDGTLGVDGTLGAGVSIDFEPPQCTASLTATANCQASCDVDASCDIKATPPKCTGGTLTVECSGSCTATGKVDVACTGNCTGGCSGSCKASGGVKVDCKGRCDGTCTAGAMGGATEAGTGIQADGSCNGQCDGTCTLDADAPKITCMGVCDGHCDAACKGTADVKVKCDGMCDADYTPLECKGGKLEGGCDVDADCQASCNASASAKAQCTPPSVAVVVKPKAGLDADGQLKLQASIASLEVNLPQLLVVFKARGTAFTDSLSAAVNAGGAITGSGKLGAKGLVCGAFIAAAIGSATDNFGASLEAAGSITASVEPK